jgi:hypothetical protein
MQTNTPGSLKEKFGNFGAAPTEQLWNSISASLDQKEKKRRGVFWWWFAGIAASGLLLFGIYYLGYQAGKSETNIAKEESKLAEQTNLSSTGPLPSVGTTSPTVDDSEKESDNSTAESLPDVGITELTNDDLKNKSNVSSTETIPLMEKTGVTNDDLKKGSDVGSAGSIPAIGITAPTYDDLTSTSTERLARLDYPKVQKISLLLEDNFDLSFAPKFEKQQPPSQWELGFSVGTQMSLSPKEEPMYFDLGNGITADFSSMENTIQGTGLLSSLSPSSGTISRPLSIDFSIARTFGKRWSLQSGLGINWTKSTTFYDSSLPSQVDVSFFSLSAPLIAEFDFVKRKRFEFSAGAGIVNEIPFYSRSASLYPVLESSAVSKSFIRGYMCSGLFNLGVSYRLTEKMKIGLHPNVRHYFFQSMKSDFPVVEKKTWFGANIGLVWEI